MGHTERLASFQGYLDKKSLDFGVITNPENICYFTGYSPYYGGQSCLIVPREGEVVLVVPEGEDQLVRGLGWRYVDSYVAFSMEKATDPVELLVRAVRRASNGDAGRIGLETARITVRTRDNIAQVLKPKSIVDIGPAISDLRICKDEDDMERIRNAVSVAEVGVKTMLSEAKQGKTEVEVLSMLKARMEIQAGSPIEVYADLISGDKCLNVGSPLEVASGKKLANGDDVIADILPKVNGYWADLTRTKHLGTRSAKRRELYTAVREAQKAAIDKVRPGIAASEIDAEARRVLSEYGYEKEFPHYTGHGIGLSFREEPILVKWNHTRLKAGMVITIEPGLYVKGAGCVRLEDDILVTGTGHDVLSSLPYE